MKIYNENRDRLSIAFPYNVIPERVTLTSTDNGTSTTYDVLDLELGGPFYVKCDLDKCRPSMYGRELVLKLGYGDTHHRSCHYLPLKNYKIIDGGYEIEYHWR